MHCALLSLDLLTGNAGTRGHDFGSVQRSANSWPALCEAPCEVWVTSGRSAETRRPQFRAGNLASSLAPVQDLWSSQCRDRTGVP